MKAKLLVTALLASMLSVPAMAGHDAPPGVAYGYYGPPAQVGQRQYANWYANNATRQARQSLALGCGYRGSRWTTSWRDHYNWALRAPRHRAQRELDRRARDLARCTRYAYRY